MPEATNALKRCCVVLTQVNRRGRNLSDTTPASAAWMQALAINNSTDFEDFLCDLLTTLRSHEQLVKREGTINQELHLRYIARVKQGLLMVRSATWGEVRGILNQGVLDTLVALSESASVFCGEQVLPEEELKNIQCATEQLINKIIEAKLNDTVKAVLIDGLEAVREAIVNYRTFGAEAIRESFDRNLGLIARYHEEFERASDDAGDEIIQDYRDILQRIDKILSVGLKIKQIASEFAPFAGMLEGIS